MGSDQSVVVVVGHGGTLKLTIYHENVRDNNHVGE